MSCRLTANFAAWRQDNTATLTTRLQESPQISGLLVGDGQVLVPCGDPTCQKPSASCW